jgi:hypothetical protein
VIRAFAIGNGASKTNVFGLFEQRRTRRDVLPDLENNRSRLLSKSKSLYKFLYQSGIIKTQHRIPIARLIEA